MIRRIFERVIWVGVVVVAIVIAGAITYSRVQLLSDPAGWVDRSERVRFSLQRILSALQDAESGARGYLISHEDVFLAPYTAARVQLDTELRSLTSLLAERPDQMARTEELARLAHARLDHLDDAVKSIRAGTFVLPKAPLASTEAVRLSDSFRALVGTMQAEEGAQLAGRLAATSHGSLTALISAVGMSGIAAALVVLLVLVGRRAAQDIRRSEQWLGAAQQALQASEERLRLALEGAELRAVDHDLRTGEAVWNDRLYVRDITETRRLEAQVRQSQKLDALGTLAGGIAHDFNNILAVLRGNLSLIRSELPVDHHIMPSVLDMERACNRATALVRQILTFGSRHDRDRQVVQLEDAVAAAARAEPKRGRGERILYLDDEESLVVLAKRLLERMGYQVTGFNDSAQALAAFKTAPGDFDLVLTDLSMPGMSGMEVSRRMLEIRPDIPVLLASGYVRNEDVEQARSIGIREVIWKPQTVGEMGDLLAQQLEKLAGTRS